ncbi:hypothetical protein Tco_0271389 [Tanacetum coccineum]
MACSLPHTDSEVEALLAKKYLNEEKLPGGALELAFQFEDSCAANCYLTEKELHQLRMDEEALRETFEEEAMNKKAQEEKLGKNKLKMTNSF